MGIGRAFCFLVATVVAEAGTEGADVCRNNDRRVSQWFPVRVARAAELMGLGERLRIPRQGGGVMRGRRPQCRKDTQFEKSPFGGDGARVRICLAVVRDAW